MELVGEQSVVVRTSAEPVHLEDGCAFYTHTIEPINIPPPPVKPRVVLTNEQIAEIRRLRETDPIKWSRSNLATRFGVEGWQISEAAPLPEEYRQKMENDKEIERLKDIFERGINPYKKKHPSSLKLPAMRRRNTERFAEMVKEEGGLKTFLRKHNLAEKRLKRGRKPPRIVVLEEKLHMDEDRKKIDWSKFDAKEYMDVDSGIIDLGRREQWEKQQEELKKRVGPFASSSSSSASASSSSKSNKPSS